MGIERSDGPDETAPPERPQSPPVEQAYVPNKPETSQPAETAQPPERQDTPGAPRRPSGAESKAIAAGERVLPDQTQDEPFQVTTTDQAHEESFDSLDAEFAARRASREYAAAYSGGSTQDSSTSEPGTVQALEPPPGREERLSEPGQNTAQSSGHLLDQQLDGQREEPTAFAAEYEQAQEQAIESDPGESLPASEMRDDERAAETAELVTDQGQLELSSSTDEQGPAETAENREWVSLPGEEHIPVTRLEMRTRSAEPEAATEQVEQDDPWRQHVEQMQANWEDHEVRWPADAPREGDGPGDDDGPPGEGSQEDVAEGSGDEPGSWRGEGGQYLNAEENYSVTRAFDRIRGVEPNMTDRLRDHESEVDGAELVAQKQRLKGEDRYKEKAAEKLDAELRRSPREAAESIADGIRYTYQIPADRYTQGYQEITDRLKEDGYQMVLSKNSWDDPEYKGINTRWRTPQGQLFEVQFHTPESFEAKQLTHGAYERIRNPQTDYREIGRLEAFQREVSAKIPVPDGTSEIPDYRREGY